VREQAGFAQHQFAHSFEIMQGGVITEAPEGGAHLWKEQLGLVAEAEEGFRASEFLASAGDGQDFFGSQGVGSRLAGVAAKGAISAIIAAQVGQRNENLARIGDDFGLEALFGGAGGGREFGQIVVGAADQLECSLAGDWFAGTQAAKRGGAIGVAFR